MKKALLLVAALLPSLWMLWQAGGMPHLGYFHDDGVYAGTAASLAEGRGFRVESLPGEPYQVKYPPLVPLYLALGARWEWGLTLLAWALLPALLYQVWLWRKDPLLVLLLGWNVYSVIFASTALSELAATMLVVWAVRLMEEDRVRASAWVAAAAYLARTAMVALPAAVVLWLLWRRRWKDAGTYAAIFTPFFVGWSLFVSTHMPPNLKGVWVYYLSYTQVFRESMSWELLPVVLSTNFSALVGSLGGVLFFNGGDSFWEMNFARLLLLAAGAGLVRRTRSGGAPVYLWMAGPYMVLLTVWNFVPTERFVYPLLPLLLDGLLTEMRHFREMLRVTWTTQRGATVVLGGLVAAGGLWMVERNADAAWRVAPAIPAAYRQRATDREQAYRWIRDNTPVTANFLAYEDTALRRHTGRHGIGIHCPARYFYMNDTPGIKAFHESLIAGMAEERLDYVLIGPNDMEQDLQTADRERILNGWKSRADLKQVYSNSRYTILRRVGAGA